MDPSKSCWNWRITKTSYLPWYPSVSWTISWCLTVTAWYPVELGDWLMHEMICRSEVSCIQIMAPFLWYLYCEPSQLQEYAKLRLTLLKVLLQPRVPGDPEQPSVLEQQILQLCCDMVPCLQVRPLVLLHWCNSSVNQYWLFPSCIEYNAWFENLDTSLVLEMLAGFWRWGRNQI